MATTNKQKAAWTSVAAAVFLTSIKLIVGLATGSLGILSEAAHSGLDLVAAVVTALAVRISGRPADADHNYGHGKVENFSALFETLLLLLTCTWIVYEAVRRIATRDFTVEANLWSFLLMAVSITVDYNRSRLLYRAAKEHQSQALEADALHFSTDIWSSGVVIVGLAMVKAGIPLGDPIAALAVAGVVMSVSYRLAKRTIDALLDTAPLGMTERLKKAVVATPGVMGCSLVRVRQSGADAFVDVKVELLPTVPLSGVAQVIQAVEGGVKSIIPTAQVMVQPAPAPTGGVALKVPSEA